LLKGIQNTALIVKQPRGILIRENAKTEKPNTKPLLKFQRRKAVKQNLRNSKNKCIQQSLNVLLMVAKCSHIQ
jgi:hypothetical protein